MLGEVTPVDLTPLRSECFYSDAHRYTFEAICAIIAAGQSPDTVTVAGRLREMERLVDVGGTPAVGKLLDNVPPSPASPRRCGWVVDMGASRGRPVR